MTPQTKRPLRAIPMLVLSLLALGGSVAVTASAEEGFLPRKTTDATAATTGSVTLETTSGAQIACNKLDESPGTSENDKHITIELHFLGCKSLGFPISSLGDKTEEILVKVLLLVCLIKSAELKFGIAAETDKPLHLEVPALAVLDEIAGQLLAEVTTKGKAKEFGVLFKGEKGKQAVTECEGKKNTLTTETNHNGKPEVASVTATGGNVKGLEEGELMDT